MSKISFKIVSSDLALVSIIFEYFLLVSSTFSEILITSENPIIEFNGVLISWLIFAKNVDFALSAFCAFKSASFKDIVLLSISFSKFWLICNNSFVFSFTLSSKCSVKSFWALTSVLISDAILLNDFSKLPISSFELTFIL